MRGYSRTKNTAKMAALTSFFASSEVYISHADENQKPSFLQIFSTSGNMAYLSDLDLGPNLFSPQLRYGSLSYNLGSSDLEFGQLGNGSLPVIQTFSQAGSLNGAIMAYVLADQIRSDLGLYEGRRDIFAGGEGKAESYTTFNLGKLHVEITGKYLYDGRGYANAILSSKLWPDDAGAFLGLLRSNEDIGLNFVSAYVGRKRDSKFGFVRFEYDGIGIGYLLGRKEEVNYSGSVGIRLSTSGWIKILDISTEISRIHNVSTVKLPYVFYGRDFGIFAMNALFGFGVVDRDYVSIYSKQAYYITLSENLTVSESKATENPYYESKSTDYVQIASLLLNFRSTRFLDLSLGFMYDGWTDEYRIKTAIAIKFKDRFLARVRLKSNLTAEFEFLALLDGKLDFEDYRAYFRSIEKLDGYGHHLSSDLVTVQLWRELMQSKQRRRGIHAIIDAKSDGDFDLKGSFFYSADGNFLEAGAHLKLQNKNPFFMEMRYPALGAEILYSRKRVFFKIDYYGGRDALRIFHEFGILFGTNY